MTIKTTVLAGLTAVAMAGGAQAASVAEPFTSLILFGDSLSDTGNVFDATGGTNPASPPYFDGRFSNGPIWVDQVTSQFDALGKPTANFAFGGAKAVTDGDLSPDFTAQLGLYAVSGFQALQGANPLVSVFFGGNDLFDLGGSLTPGLDGQNVAITLGQQIDQLAFAGLTSFALWNVPDVSLTPAVNLFEPSAIPAASAAADAFNAQLAIEAQRLRDLGATVYEIDLSSLFDDFISDPTAFGFTDATLPCLFPTPGAAALFGQSQVCTGTDIENRLFFDSVHPNTQGHAQLAQIFAATVAPVPLPASSLLLLAGLGGLVVMRKRAA